MNPLDKIFKIPGERIRRLIPPAGSCIASDRITVDGSKVGFMYREQPDDDLDSGWRLFAGDESQEYADTADHFAIYDVNTICNYDPDIIPLLDAPYGSAFERRGWFRKFVPVPFVPPNEDEA